MIPISIRQGNLSNLASVSHDSLNLLQKCQHTHISYLARDLAPGFTPSNFNTF